MAQIAKLFTRQVCIYWAPAGYDKHGQLQSAAPVALRCRWDDMAKMFLDKTGQTAVSRSEVMTLVPVELDGYLWLVPGDILRDATDPLNATWEARALALVAHPDAPLSNPGCYPIRSREATPNYNYTETIYNAIL